MCVVMSWDVLSVGVSTADWQLFVHIHIVMTKDQYKTHTYIYIYVRETFLYYLTAEDSFWISFKFNFKGHTRDIYWNCYMYFLKQLQVLINKIDIYFIYFVY